MSLPKNKNSIHLRTSYPNLFLIAGNGRKSGKTTLACRLIEQFCNEQITAIKVSPHIHLPTQGLSLLCEQMGYSILEETSRETGKDTSRMLQSGAAKVYYIRIAEGALAEAFSETMAMIPSDSPVVCESPSLFHYVVPGVFVIMINDNIPLPKDLTEMRKQVHIELTLEKLTKTAVLPFSFAGGRWNYK